MSTDPGEWAGSFAASPDAFERLWTPHRMVYLRGENRPDSPDAEACPFCHAPELSDATGLIVHRGALCYVVMNLYPYNPGHLLVCPYRHVADYDELNEAERAEFGALSADSMRALRAASGPAGFNLGMNQGSVAGAGIAGHLHQHIVPRWFGDANFLPVIARTRALPELIEDARARLVSAWPASSAAQ